MGRRIDASTNLLTRSRFRQVQIVEMKVFFSFLDISIVNTSMRNLR
jgi:hypothetical protein